MKRLFTPLPWLICRNAAMSYNHHKETSLKDAMNDPFFRAALAIASDSLYQKLVANDFRLELLPEKVKTTIWKYFNRICHRTTPFGAFSAFSLCYWTRNQTRIIFDDKNIKLYLKADFSELIQIYEQQDRTAFWKKSFQTNPSLYYTARDLRYFFVDRESDKFNYSIRHISPSAALKNITLFCLQPLTGKEITDYIQLNITDSNNEAQELLQNLLNQQIIIPVFRPNLIGEDFQDRVASYLNLPPEQSTKLTKFNFISGRDKISSWVKEKYLPPVNTLIYANLELAGMGQLNDALADQLQEGAELLFRLGGAMEPSGLKMFKRRFKDKFADQVIPLLNALDPETGISYEGLAQHDMEDQLITGIAAEEPSDQPAEVWGAIQKLLVNKWPISKGEPIILKDDDLVDFTISTETKLPPSFSVLFRQIDGNVIIEQSGGVTATALAGRFTPFNSELERLCRNIADQESKANPDVIFAEISCITEIHTANISRRSHLRDYEIPILTGSTLAKEYQIQLKDLMLSIEGNELMLWSARLQKRIIPRLSSAYNFKRSDLPVFRFLGDLQYQGIVSGVNADLSKLLPGLKYYPRLMYKQCILSPACWFLDAKELPKQADKDAVERFRIIASDIGLPDVFTLNQSDQFLVFNLNDTKNTILFLSLISEITEVRLNEYLKEADTNGCVKDSAGFTYASQFVASFVNTEPSYIGPFQKPLTGITKDNKKYIPGSNWLYYKVYTPSYNTDHVLLALEKKIAALCRTKQIKRWFFIRYKDPEVHLRIRLEVPDGGAGLVLNELSGMLNNLQRKEFIKNVQTGTYEPESARYSPLPIIRTESLFCHSTALIIAGIKRLASNKFNNRRYALALRPVYDITVLVIPNHEERLAFFNSVKHNFIEEFGSSKNLIRSLDQKKRALREEVKVILNDALFFTENRLTDIRDTIFKELLEMKAQYGITTKNLADLNHMHINRIFITNMRMNEMVIYTLLLQYELSRKYTIEL